LTVDYAKHQGLNIRGLILNNYDESNFMHVDNKKQIKRLTGIDVIACVKKGDKDLNISKDTILKILEDK
jgi:dethiobiotin synthetase